MADSIEAKTNPPDRTDGGQAPHKSRHSDYVSDRVYEGTRTIPPERVLTIMKAFMRSLPPTV